MANKPRNKNYGDWLNLVQTRQKFNPTHEEGSFAWRNLPSGFVLTAYSETVDLVALRMTLRSVLGPHKIVLESLVPQWCWTRLAPATVSVGWLWEMRSAIVARVRDRKPMEVADDLGHRFGRLLPYG